uniref:(northern house mosquito) hypothetical protein n=1 Tax=Culex pipiens TaxID=7175 RepID=A0A8D8K1N4_CULPI
MLPLQPANTNPSRSSQNMSPSRSLLQPRVHSIVPSRSPIQLSNMNPSPDRQKHQRSSGWCKNWRPKDPSSSPTPIPTQTANLRLKSSSTSCHISPSSACRLRLQEKIPTWS